MGKSFKYIGHYQGKRRIVLNDGKGNPLSFLKEIPDDFTFTNSMSFKSVVEPVKRCSGCNISVEEDYRLFALRK